MDCPQGHGIDKVFNLTRKGIRGRSDALTEFFNVTPISSLHNKFLNSSHVTSWKKLFQHRKNFTVGDNGRSVTVPSFSQLEWSIMQYYSLLLAIKGLTVET